jgi:hypothetical protein
LGTDTDGNYVASVAAGNGISVSGTAGEGYTATVSTKFHGVFAYRSSSVSTTSGAYYTISWNAERYDTDGYRSSGSDFVIPSGLAGYYMLTANVEWASNSTGRRHARIIGPDHQAYVFQNAVNGFSTGVTLTWVGYLAVSDAINVESWQDSGGALNIAPTATRTWAQLTYLGA